MHSIEYLILRKIASVVFVKLNFGFLKKTTLAIFKKLSENIQNVIIMCLLQKKGRSSFLFSRYDGIFSSYMLDG